MDELIEIEEQGEEKNNQDLFAVISHARFKKIHETERVLPAWLTNPTRFPGNIAELSRDIDEFAAYIDSNDLLPYLRDFLQITKLFPVQQCLVPYLFYQLKSSMYRRPNDICVSSPTGSGKTLAFVIPIVNHYMKRSGRALRVLVLSPVRDLGIQLHKVFVQVCRRTHLKVGLAVAEKNFQEVSRSLIDVKFQCNQRNTMHDFVDESVTSKTYSSAVDILVATPGCLSDLVQNCPGFNLSDLELLVIDEADKMMNKCQHDWINLIEKSAFVDKANMNLGCPCEDSVSLKTNRVCFSCQNSCSLNHSARSRPLQKLLFSATLSSDPQQLLNINLFQPRLFIASIESKPTTTDRARKVVSSKNSDDLQLVAVTTKNELLTSSTIPDQLEEKMLRITEPPVRFDRLSRPKAFAIWYFLHELKYRRVICFVNLQIISRQLVRFLNHISGVSAAEFSSSHKGERREKDLRRFDKGKINILVSTDLMARGMDVEDVEYIISFDMPKDSTDYVHRIGRTARAGKRGTAITFVQTSQVLSFVKIVQHAHVLPNTMKLGDVVQEIEIPKIFIRNPEKQDGFNKCWDDFNDEERRINRNKQH